MRERSLVAFTVLGQAAAGMLAALAAVWWVWGAAGRVGSAAGAALAPDAWLVGPLLGAGGLLLAAGVAAVLHLGSPRNAWRALTGMGSSWLSREVLLAAVLGAVWLLATVLHTTGLGGPGLRGGALVLAAVMGVALVYAMARVYRLRTAPVWDTVLTTASFFLTAAVLGSLATALALSLDVPGPEPAIRELTWVAMAGLMAELVLIPVMRRHVEEARRATDPGLRGEPPGRWATLGRGALLGAGLLASIGALFMATVGAGSIGMALVPPTLIVALAAALAGEVLGRAAFYAGYARVGM